MVVMITKIADWPPRVGSSLSRWMKDYYNWRTKPDTSYLEITRDQPISLSLFCVCRAKWINSLPLLNRTSFRLANKQAGPNQYPRHRPITPKSHLWDRHRRAAHGGSRLATVRDLLHLPSDARVADWCSRVAPRTSSRFAHLSGQIRLQ